MPELSQHVGIDFGANLAGTTAIAYFHTSGLEVVQSQKGKPAFDFIINFVCNEDFNMVFIDAPLSLPAAYYQKGVDYFFRKCDRETAAMSPMFLGGLTANAMRLAARLRQSSIAVNEVYPAALVKTFPELESEYRKKSKDFEPFVHAFSALSGFSVNTNIKNRHQMDALLAWYSGYRYINQQAKIIGDSTEGLIIV